MQPKATATPNKPRPAMTGPTLFPKFQVMQTPKKIIKYLSEFTIHATKAFESVFSSLLKKIEKGISN